MIRGMVVLAAVLSVGASVASGCTCGTGELTTCRHFDAKWARVLFMGTVMEVENPATEQRTDQAGTSRYRFRVEKNISGMDKEFVDIYSGRGLSDCSYRFRVGQTYLVNPYLREDKFSVIICSLTRPVDAAVAQRPLSRDVFGALVVRVQWADEPTPNDVCVSATDQTGYRSFGLPILPGVFRLGLFGGMRYSIYAYQDCVGPSVGKASTLVERRETERVEFNGSDERTQELNLRLVDATCKAREVVIRLRRMQASARPVRQKE